MEKTYPKICKYADKDDPEEILIDAGESEGVMGVGLRGSTGGETEGRCRPGWSRQPQIGCRCEQCSCKERRGVSWFYFSQGICETVWCDGLWGNR